MPRPNYIHTHTLDPRTRKMVADFYGVLIMLGTLCALSSFISTTTPLVTVILPPNKTRAPRLTGTVYSVTNYDSNPGLPDF